MTAGNPLIKKKGMIGINAPSAVDSEPDTAEVTGLLSASSVRFSYSAAMVLRNWPGFTARYSAIFKESSSGTPLSW